MKDKKKQGFTLVELLAVVVIISVVLGIVGYAVTNIIKTSKDESTALAIANIKSSARIYVEENTKKVSWQQVQENHNKKYSCVSINELVNKNLLKKDVKEEHPDIKYVIVTKDENDTIISEELDEENICSFDEFAIEIPTKEYCNDNLTYNKANQDLVGVPKYNFKWVESTKTAKDAGIYKVEAELIPSSDPNINYHWTDGTTENKIITCKIKKATPNLVLNPTGTSTETIAVGSTVTTTFTSDVKGKITIKSSNKEYLEGKNKDGNALIEANGEKEIEIKFLASREILNSVKSYVTVTLTPDDKKNYYSTSSVYTVGDITKIGVNIPDVESYCLNPEYNGSEQYLVNNPAEGFRFYNYKAKDIGTYTVTAKLKYGYYWIDKTNPNNTDDTVEKTIQCKIARPTVDITYDNNGGVGCTNVKVTYGASYGENGKLCTPTKTGYTFDGWYTSKNDGTKITEDTIVENVDDHTLWAHWVANNYTIAYSLNGGTNGTSAPTSGTYDTEIGISYPTKTGYNFVGWTFNGNTSTAKYGTTSGNANTAWSNGDTKVKAQFFKNLTDDKGGTVTMSANWEAASVSYKIEHYVMNTSGSYPTTATSTETKTGITGSTLTLSDQKKTTTNYNVANGISYSHGAVNGSNVTTTTIEADGSLVVKLYYKRTYGTLTTVAGTYVSSVTTQNNVKYYYGASVSNLNATLNSDASYTYTFNKWTSSNTTYLADQSSNPASFTWPAMPEGTAITLTASATRKSATYTIKYNLNNGTKGTYAPTSGTIDSSVRISNPTRTNYTFAGWTFNGNISTAKYGSYSSLILTSWSSTSTKVKNEYFKNLASAGGTVTMTANWTANDTEEATNTYTIKYNLNNGTKGTYAPTSGTINSSVRISNPTRTNYTFAGWTFNGNTSTAKYGSSSSNIATSWSSTSTKVKNEYFKNLASAGGTVTMTANWTANDTGSNEDTTSDISCSISYSGTVGNNDWYVSDVTVNLTTSGNVSSKGLTTSTTATYNNSTSATQSDTTGATWYGYVKDASGNTASCKGSTIKVDKTPPATPTLTTMYEVWGTRTYTINNESYSSDVGISGTWNTTANDPFISFTGLSDYSNISGAYVELASALSKEITIQIYYQSGSDGFSATNYVSTKLPAGQKKIVIPFTSGNWTKIRFDIGTVSGLSYQIKSLGVVAKANLATIDDIYLQGKSSDSMSGINYWQYNYINSTNSWVTYSDSAMDTFITTPYSADRNEYTAIRACDYAGNCSSYTKTLINITRTKYMYACRSGADAYFTTGNTFIYSLPSYNATYNGKTVYTKTIATGTKVIILDGGTIYNSYFYKVQLESTSDFSTENPYYDAGLYGYIRTNCLTSTAPNSSSYCLFAQCPDA